MKIGKLKHFEKNLLLPRKPDMDMKFPMIFRNDYAREEWEKACVQKSSAVTAHNKENRSD